MPKKPAKPKSSKTTLKLDKSKKPTEPADENRSQLLKPSAWNEFYKQVVKRAFSGSNKRRVGDSFQPWLDKLIASEVEIGGGGKTSAYNIKTALQKTWQLDRTGTDDLIYWVLCACYQAATTDLPDKSRRQKDSEFEEEIFSQRKALKKITKFMKRYPEDCDMALFQAYHAWRENHPGYGIQVNTGGETLSWDTLFESLLTCYATQLKNGVMGVKRGNFMHRWKAGPLLYPDSDPLDQQNAQPDARVNGLVFHLAFLFRLYTIPNPHGRWMSGEPMPTSGKPCISLVTLLTNATLKENLSTGQADFRIRSLVKKGVGLIGW